MRKKYLITLGLVALAIILISFVYFNMESNVSKKSIKVGAVLPLSGFLSFSGQEMQRGMDMCNPGNIQYVYEDSAGVAATGVTAYNKLTKIDNVDITIVGMSTVVPAILPLAKENKEFVIATIVTAKDVGKNGGDTVFRYYLDGYETAQNLANSMVEQGANKVGIMYSNNEFGKTYRDGAHDFLKTKGLPVYSESFGLADSDFSTQLLKLKEKRVDSILVIAYDKQTFHIISKIKELDLKTDIFTAWMWQNKDYTTNPIVLENVYVSRSSYLFGSNEKAIVFNEKFASKFNSDGSQFSAIGCDLSILIGKEIDSPDKLTEIKSFNGISGDVIQKDNGEFNFPSKTIQFVNGSVNILD